MKGGQININNLDLTPFPLPRVLIHPAGVNVAWEFK